MERVADLAGRFDSRYRGSDDALDECEDGDERDGGETHLVLTAGLVMLKWS